MIITGKLSKSRTLALNFFADSLLTKQLSKHIIVTVKMSKKYDNLGLTCVEDYNASGKPREFILEIKSDQTEVEILRTLAHEMVHVRQYATGQLNEYMTVWNGKKVPANLSYAEQPWEIEAFSVGDILCMEYTNETIRT